MKTARAKRKTSKAPTELISKKRVLEILSEVREKYPVEVFSVPGPVAKEFMADADRIAAHASRRLCDVLAQIIAEE